jgi:hypothetical protein
MVLLSFVVGSGFFEGFSPVWLKDGVCVLAF